MEGTPPATNSNGTSAAAAAAAADAKAASPKYSFQQRFMQKLALSCIMLNIIGPFWHWPLALALLYFNPFTIGRGFVAAYLLYIFVLDKDAHTKPDGPTPIRRLKFWKNIANYFPATLVKSCELDPKANYLFCGHPHGVACFSYVANFFIEGTGFSEVFPGIRMFPSLLEQHFFTPFHREIALWSGFRGNSKKALLNLLQGPLGTSVFLVPGGAPEVLKCQPGTLDLVLNKRKGFIKLALQTGAQLVPVLAFGETDLFEISQPTPGSLMHKIQQLVLRFTKFGIPSISGAGFYCGSGPLPRPRPLTTVIGPPVRVVKWSGSTNEPAFEKAVNELHERYCDALKALYNTHKGKYAQGRRKSLEIVE